MTAHMHQELIDGCYRCDLNRDEIEAAEREEREQAEREANCPGHVWREYTGRFGQQWIECARCGAEEDR